MARVRDNIYTKISLEKYFFDLTFTDFQMDRQKVVIILEKFQKMLKNVNTKENYSKIIFLSKLR